MSDKLSRDEVKALAGETSKWSASRFWMAYQRLDEGQLKEVMSHSESLPPKAREALDLYLSSGKPKASQAKDDWGHPIPNAFISFAPYPGEEEEEERAPVGVSTTERVEADVQGDSFENSLIASFKGDRPVLNVPPELDTSEAIMDVPKVGQVSGELPGSNVETDINIQAPVVPDTSFAVNDTAPAAGSFSGAGQFNEMGLFDVGGEALPSILTEEVVATPEVVKANDSMLASQLGETTGAETRLALEEGFKAEEVSEKSVSGIKAQVTQETIEVATEPDVDPQDAAELIKQESKRLEGPSKKQYAWLMGTTAIDSATMDHIAVQTSALETLASVYADDTVKYRPDLVRTLNPLYPDFIQMGRDLEGVVNTVFDDDTTIPFTDLRVKDLPAGAFLPFQEAQVKAQTISNLDRMVKEAGIDVGQGKDVINFFKWDRMANVMAVSSPAQKQMLIPYIAEAIKMTGVSESQAHSLMADLLGIDPSFFSSGFWVTIDSLDFAGVGAGKKFSRAAAKADKIDAEDARRFQETLETVEAFNPENVNRAFSTLPRQTQARLSVLPDVIAGTAVAASAPVHMSRTANDMDTVANVMGDAAADAGERAAMGVDGVDAQASTSPFNYEMFGFGYDDVSPAVQARLDEVDRGINRVREITPVTPQEVANEALQRSMDEVSAIADRDGMVLEQATPLNVDYSDPSEWVFNYKTTDGNEIRVPVLLDYNGVEPWTIKDVGQLKSAFAQPSFTPLSPDFTFHKVQDNLVSDLTLVREQYTRNVNYLEQALNSTVRGLGKTNRDNLGRVLEAGDTWNIQDGTVFSWEELTLSGIPMEDGTRIKLSDKAAAGYVNTRRIYDLLDTWRNTARRSEYFNAGFRNTLSIEPSLGFATNFENMIVKKVDDFKVGGQKATRFYDTRTGQVVDEAAVQGRDVVEFAEPVTLLDNAGTTSETVLHAIVDSVGALDTLPRRVIHSRKGYVFKMNKNVRFLVKRKVASVVGGVEKEHWITEAFASTKVNAQRLADSLEGDLKVVGDREWTTVDHEFVSQGTTGVPTYHRRSTRQLMHDTLDGLPRRTNVFTSTQRAISRTVADYSLTDFKQATTSKFLATYGDLLRDKTDWLSPIEATGSEARSAQAMQDYLRQTLAPYTEKDAIVSTFLHEAGNVLDAKMAGEVGKVSETLRPWVAGFMHSVSKLPATQMVRGLAYTTLVSLANIGMYFVQSMGALNATILAATSLRPYRAVKYMAQSQALVPAMMARRFGARFPNMEKAVMEVGRLTTKLTGLSDKEFAKVVDILEETGFIRDMASNSDYADFFDGYGVTHAMVEKTMNGLKKAANVASVPNTMGELNARTINMLWAIDEYAHKAGKNILELDSQDVRKIFDKAQAVGGNFTRSNMVRSYGLPVAT
jgi:hypothetical protein